MGLSFRARTRDPAERETKAASRKDAGATMLIQGVLPRDCSRSRISRPQFSARSCHRGFIFTSVAALRTASVRGMAVTLLLLLQRARRVSRARPLIRVLMRSSFASPAFDLFFATDCNLHVLVAFVVDQAMALVFLGKSLDRVALMLINTLVKKAGDSDVERTGSAAQDIDPKLVMEAVAYEEKRSTRCSGRTPRIGMAGDASSGFLDVVLSRYPSLVLARNDRP